MGQKGDDKSGFDFFDEEAGKDFEDFSDMLDDDVDITIPPKKEEEVKDEENLEGIDSDPAKKGEEGEGKDGEGDTPSSEPATPPVEGEGESKDTPPATSATDEDDKYKELKEQNAALLARVEELMGNSLQKPSEGTKPEATPTPAPVKKEGDVYDLVGEEDLDEILSSKEKFNSFMSRAINLSINSAVENTLRSMPQVVSAQVRQQQQMQTYVDEFYKENKDLEPVKKTVGAVANTVYSENPAFTLDEVFSETAKRVRTMLGLKKQAAPSAPAPQTPPAEKPSQKPALPGVQKSGARSQGVELTGQAKHIAEVL